MGTVPGLHLPTVPPPRHGWGSSRILLDLRPLFFFFNSEDHLYSERVTLLSLQELYCTILTPHRSTINAASWLTTDQVFRYRYMWKYPSFGMASPAFYIFNCCYTAVSLTHSCARNLQGEEPVEAVKLQDPRTSEKASCL